MPKKVYVGVGEASSNTMLLLHGESIVDSSALNNPITNTGVTVSSEKSKFGGKSLYFNGSSYLTLNNFDFPNGTSDFTIDWWEYPTATGDGGAVYWRGPATTGCGFLCGYMNEGNSTVLLSYNGSDWDELFKIIGAIKANTWTHRAIVRKNGKFYLFANGILQTTFDSTDPFTLTDAPKIGVYDYNSQPTYFNGYIDELRVSSIARWTSNFAPPTSPYSADPVQTIGGVSRQVKKQYIGDTSVSRKIKSGYIGVNAVARQFFASGIPLSEIPVGSIIKLNESGVPVEFYVACHNYNPGRTLVVRKDCHSNRRYYATQPTGYARYEQSNLRSWLNSNYRNLLDAEVISAIAKTTIEANTSMGEVYTLNEFVFLLSGKEAGGASIGGKTLPISSQLKIAYMNGSKVDWWTRSQSASDTFRVETKSGTEVASHLTTSNAVRPAFTLPGTLLFNDDMTIAK